MDGNGGRVSLLHPAKGLIIRSFSHSGDVGGISANGGDKPEDIEKPGLPRYDFAATLLLLRFWVDAVGSVL